jgi:hypothetical protein
MGFDVRAQSTAGGIEYVRPDSTDPTTLFTAGAERAFVHALRFVNDTGTNRTVTVTHYRASQADTLPLFGAAIAVDANTEVEKTLPGHLLLQDDEIRVTVSNADSIRCWAYIAQRGE